MIIPLWLAVSKHSSWSRDKREMREESISKMCLMVIHLQVNDISLLHEKAETFLRYAESTFPSDTHQSMKHQITTKRWAKYISDADILAHLLVVIWCFILWPVLDKKMLSVCKKNVSTFLWNSESLQYQQIINVNDIPKIGCFIRKDAWCWCICTGYNMGRFGSKYKARLKNVMY